MANHTSHRITKKQAAKMALGRMQKISPEKRRAIAVHAAAIAAAKNSRPLADRFWEKVNKSGPIPSHRPDLGECWEWTASIGTTGYGQIQCGRSNGGMRKTHHVAWLLQYGGIPAGQCVLHHCDNRKCVRDTHLWLGTKAQNNKDRNDKGRQKGVAPGERHWNRKLTDADVIEIRRLSNAGVKTAALVERLGVCRSMIKFIKSGHSWKHLYLSKR